MQVLCEICGLYEASGHKMKSLLKKRWEIDQVWSLKIFHCGASQLVTPKWVTGVTRHGFLRATGRTWVAEPQAIILSLQCPNQYPPGSCDVVSVYFFSTWEESCEALFYWNYLPCISIPLNSALIVRHWCCLEENGTGCPHHFPAA